MDKIEKAIARLSGKERVWLKNILQKLSEDDLKGLDIKRLKGRDDIFRIRKGNLRFIYRMQGTKFFILTIERRNESKYKDIK